jgi:predicted TIM-barrel fold metal-dependent hydrolase
MSIATFDEANKWRLETPGHEGWQRTARPDDPNRYLMISCDCHANEPANLWSERLDEKYRSRLPRFEIDEKGVKWMVSDGLRRSRIQESIFEGEDLIRNRTGANVAERRHDDLRDGVDAEIVFPNKGLFMWATPDAQFAQAQCRVWNDWAWETYGACNDHMSPMAALATADVEGTLVEIERVAKLGFRGVTMPCKPVWNSQDARDPNYNMRIYDRMWALIQETNLPVTFHIGTGRDPRAASKEGGAVMNYVAHALVQAIEPVTALCASGVLERFPGIKFAAIESGIGWVPWALDAMDEGYTNHHMWAQPKLKMLPSEYFRAHGAVAFQEDRAGLALAVQFNLVDNFLWSNDYPHHEGSWPHSAEAIERQMGHLTDQQRTKILGLNAASFFKFDIDSLLRRRSAAINST